MTNPESQGEDSSSTKQKTSSPPSIDEFIKTRKQKHERFTPSKRTHTFQEKTISIEVKREQTRSRLAGGLLGLLALSLLGIGTYICSDIWFSGNTDQQKSDLHRELMTIVWTSQVTLVSGALGYYFGSEHNKNNSEN